MTEKRFTKDDTLMFSAIKNNGKPMKVKEVVDLLNALHEENQKLLTLSNMKKGALVEVVKDLTKENEQLKQQIQDMQIRFKRKYDYEFDEIVDELE